jgi:dihydrofolate reductase
LGNDAFKLEESHGKGKVTKKMRKVILFMMLSLDGYFEGPNHDLSWHNVDNEFNRFVIQQMKEVDLIIFGKRTYQTMESFWPQAQDDPKMSKENLIVARLMNNMNKIVISRTLNKIREHKNWKNVKIVHKFDPKEIMRLKKQAGKAIWVGGSNLALSFIRASLIDEFRFTINPVVIGAGTPIFQGLGRQLKLELIKTRKFRSGNVMQYYRPKK